MPPESPPTEENAAERKEPGLSWKQNEEHVLPRNRLGIVSFALVCTMFLGTVDQVGWVSLVGMGLMRDLPKTIIATALPTIVAHLGGGNNYSWVGRYAITPVPSLYRWVHTRRASAYMLAAGTFSPLYGKLSNMFGGLFFADVACRRCSLYTHFRAKTTPLFEYTRVFGLFSGLECPCLFSHLVL